MIQEISEFLLRTLTQLILFVILLRFFLQMARVNFRNPLAQAIVRLTSPLVVPVRRVVPPIGKIDTATLVVAYVVQVALLAALILLRGGSPGSSLFIYAAIELVRMSLMLYTYAIIIWVVLGWISPGSYNPVSALIDEWLRPFMAPFRRLIPPIAGLDLSPLFAMIALGVGQIVVNNVGKTLLG
ncbi:MAG: YggT family protein [Pseudomonadota bacterium]